ncbi:MAG: hypothetical protein BWY38_03290 [Ignavibacteria bacterium ADurb.Bin266]|nr:MAG: hypothetical protein BWY38_03290 [Ignavibacteria bacterium ADurb.Bin266]
MSGSSSRTKKDIPDGRFFSLAVSEISTLPFEIGRKILKTVPLFIIDLTTILPPCFFTIAIDVDSPKPEPFSLVVKYGSNIL